MPPRNAAATLTVVSNAPALLRLVQAAVDRKVTAMGMEYRANLAEHVLTGDRTGRTYRVPGTRTTYRASAPGEPPARRLGDLARSYTLTAPTSAPEGTFVRVGSALDYALKLEVGDASVKPRPHLGPALELTRPAIRSILTGEWGI